MWQTEWKNGLLVVRLYGFNIMPPLNPTQFELFVNKVVPILVERGLVQTEYNEGTLREKLGLSTTQTYS